MAYAMTHLIIANEFAKFYQIENKDLFLLASIAPDAVHARSDFELPMKAKCHFMQEGQRWGEMYEEVPMQIWYDRLHKIYEERLKLAQNDKDVIFWKGYLVHLLADVFNCQLMYAPDLIKHGLDVSKFRVKYREECIRQDAFLFQVYPESKEILASLERAMRDEMSEDILEHLQLQDFFSLKNLCDNTNFQVRMFSEYEPVTLEGQEMITLERTEYFLRHVLEESKRLLYDFPDCGRTFKVPENI